MVSKINKIDFVVFDFDGVVVDSTTLKTNIFRKVVESYSTAQQDIFIEYHKLHGGVSRWEKFDYFCRKVIKLKDDKEIIETSKKLANDFTNLLAKGLNNLQLTEGAEQLLIKLNHHGKKCYIVSGGAEVEVKEIVNKNNIHNYFEYVLGSPKNKHENLVFLKNLNKLNGKGIFIGDSYTDYKSANDFGIDFVYMKKYSEWKSWKNDEANFFLKIDTLKDLETYLDNEDI